MRLAEAGPSSQHFHLICSREAVHLIPESKDYSCTITETTDTDTVVVWHSVLFFLPGRTLSGQPAKLRELVAVLRARKCGIPRMLYTHSYNCLNCQKHLCILLSRF